MKQSTSDVLTRILLLDTKPLEFWTSLIVVAWSLSFFIEGKSGDPLYQPLFSYPALGYVLIGAVLLSNLNVLRGVIACFRKGSDQSKDIKIRYIWTEVSLFCWMVLGGYIITVATSFNETITFALMICVELWVFLHLMWVRKKRAHLERQMNPRKE